MKTSIQKFITCFAAAIALFSFFTPSVVAAPVWGQIMEITNSYTDHSGKPVSVKIKVKVWGDEFYTHVETLGGYTLIRDPKTCAICYAVQGKDGELVSSKIIYTGAGTKEEQDFERYSRKQIIEKLEIINEKARINRARLGADRMVHIPPPKNTMTTQSVSSNPYYNPYYAGSIKGLTLLIDFPDERGTISQAQVDNFCNSLTYSDFGNNGSIRKYYQDVSGGAVDYTNVVTAYYTAKNNKSYYTDPKITAGTRARELVLEALTNLSNKGFNFSQLSKDSVGDVRAFNILYAGGRDSAWSEGLWPHSGGVNWGTFNGVSFFNYQITDMPQDLFIGTFAHENGHMVFDWPDTYDYTFLTLGLGWYDIMSSSGWPNPAPPNPYFRNVLAGWGEPETLNNLNSNTTASVQANQVGAQVFKRNTEKEFFMVENIEATGRWSHFGTSGLYIWHVESEKGNNSNTSYMTPELHALVSLEQADGRFDLERGYPSDSTDAYRAGNVTSFTDTTVPNSKWWDGSSSGFNIKNISNAGSVMTYTFKTQLDEYAVNFHTVNGNGTFTATVNGKAITTGAKVQESSDVVFTAAPNNDYQIKEWKHNDEIVNETASAYTISDLSEAATVTVEFESSCAAPPAVTIPRRGLNKTSAIINWTGNASSYVIEYKKSAEPVWKLWSSNLTSNATTLTSLEPNTSYDVRVKAICSTGIESEYGTLTFSNAPIFTWEIGYPNAKDVTAGLYYSGTFNITGTGEMMNWEWWAGSMPWHSINDEIYSVVINKGVTSIGDCSFQGCANLSTVFIPNTVTIIGNLAFAECLSLPSITIPNSVESIGSWAFSTFCPDMTTIEIPNSVTYIGQYAFDWLSGLTDMWVHWEIPLEVPAPFAPNTDFSRVNLHVPSGTQCVYAAAPVWQDFKIVKLPQTIDFPEIPTKIYGDAPITLPPTSDAGLTISYESSNTDVATVSGNILSILCAGTAEITASQSGDCTYAAATVSRTLTVQKTPLTITAENKTRKQREANPAFTLVYSGFKNNETASVLDVLPTITCTATVNSPAGVYDIVLSGGSDKNYQYTLVNGVLDVIAVTGNEDEMAHQIQIYPNPFTGDVRITGVVETGRAPSVQLQITNASGAIVHTQMITNPDETIHLAHLPAGVYLFIVEVDGKTITKKVIKN